MTSKLLLGQLARAPQHSLVLVGERAHTSTANGILPDARYRFGTMPMQRQMNNHQPTTSINMNNVRLDDEPIKYYCSNDDGTAQRTCVDCITRRTSRSSFRTRLLQWLAFIDIPKYESNDSTNSFVVAALCWSIVQFTQFAVQGFTMSVMNPIRSLFDISFAYSVAFNCFHFLAIVQLIQAVAMRKELYGVYQLYATMRGEKHRLKFALFSVLAIGYCAYEGVFILIVTPVYVRIATNLSRQSAHGEEQVYLATSQWAFVLFGVLSCVCTLRMMGAVYAIECIYSRIGDNFRSLMDELNDMIICPNTVQSGRRTAIIGSSEARLLYTRYTTLRYAVVQADEVLAYPLALFIISITIKLCMSLYTLIIIANNEDYDTVFQEHVDKWSSVGYNRVVLFFDQQWVCIANLGIFAPLMIVTIAKATYVNINSRQVWHKLNECDWQLADPADKAYLLRIKAVALNPTWAITAAKKFNISRTTNVTILSMCLTLVSLWSRFGSDSSNIGVPDHHEIIAPQM